MLEMTEERIEKSVRNITAIMSYEDMELTKKDKNNLRRVLSGKATSDEIIAEILKEHNITKTI